MRWMVVGVVRAGRDLVGWQFYWTVHHHRRHTVHWRSAGPVGSIRHRRSESWNNHVSSRSTVYVEYIIHSRLRWNVYLYHHHHHHHHHDFEKQWDSQEMECWSAEFWACRWRTVSCILCMASLVTLPSFSCATSFSSASLDDTSWTTRKQSLAVISLGPRCEYNSARYNQFHGHTCTAHL